MDSNQRAAQHATAAQPIIRYGEPRCISNPSGAAVPRSSIFAHPRELDDPSTHPLARRMTLHGIPGEMTRRPSEKVAPRRHSEIVPTEMELVQHLNEICPPKEWTENSLYYVQTLEKHPCSREETIELASRIEHLLTSRRAKQTGICAIRREIFSQLFDELLRQVSTENLLWGKLLLRIRNEINMILEAYAVLFNSSLSFGRTQFIQMTTTLPMKREKKEKLQKDMKQLTEEIDTVKREIYQKSKSAERFQKEQEETERMQREKSHKLQQSYLVAFDNLSNLTVSYKPKDWGRPVKEVKSFNEVNADEEGEKSSYIDKPVDEINEGQLEGSQISQAKSDLKQMSASQAEKTQSQSHFSGQTYLTYF